MSIIKTVKEINTFNNSPIFIDVRTKDKEFETGMAAYQKSHIPGAVFLDMKTDLTGEQSFLPDMEVLCRKLGEMGISHETDLVIYDRGNQRSAAKAWYLFDYLGHKNVYILQGGYPAWIDAGQPVTEEVPSNKQVAYQADIQPFAAKTIEEVKLALMGEDATLIDSRAPKRYLGQEEPKYKKAGHIPGAKNLHAKAVFQSNGDWKEAEQLKQNFNKLDKEKEIIVSCGSGNSACMNYVALKEAGFQHVSLFSGGFGEWISDDQNEVIKGDEDEGNQK